MASSLSLSQSLTKSLILYQHYYYGQEQNNREQRQKHQHPNGEQQDRWDKNKNGKIISDRDRTTSCGCEASVTTTSRQVGLFQQFMLTFISFGYSCSIEFEAVYGVVSMQYFGLPVFFVSLPGLFSGSINSFLVPVLGRFSDKGPNPLKRKLILLSMTSVCLLIGWVTLGICSWIKFVEMNKKPYESIALRFSSDGNNSSHLNPTLQESVVFSTNTTFSKLDEHIKTESEIPIIAIFSVLPFILYDTGYDTSIAMSRATVLEIISTQQRNSILTMAGLMSGIAGLLAAVVGLIDFPGILGSAFNIDGFALSLLSFSVLFGCLGLVSSVTSIKSIWKSHCESKKINNNSKIPQTEFYTCSRKMSQSESFHNSRNDSKLLSDYGPNNTDAAISTQNTPNTILLSSNQEQAMPSKGYQSLISSIENSSVRNATHQDISRFINEENKGCLKIPESYQHYTGDNKDKSPAYIEGKNLITDSFDFNASHENVFGLFHLQKLKEAEINKTQRDKETNPKSNSLCNAQFCICILAIFFSGIVVCSTTLYQSNTLTLEVYKGEPLALPGSPGRLRYEEGIKMSSFGILAAYVSYFVFTIASPKLMSRFGALIVVIASNCFATITSSMFYAYPSLETYFAMMSAYGINKFVYLAVNFIMAMQYANLNVDEESEKLVASGDDDQQLLTSPSSKTGQVLSIVATTVPAGYIIMSAVLGPWMDDVGNAWPPVLLNIGTGVTAVSLGAILYILEKIK